MTVTLAALANRLAGLVPAQDGAPTTEQYYQAVRDAVADLGRRASVTMLAALDIVAGQAAYALPAECIKIIQLQPIGALVGGDTIVSSAGLIPLGWYQRATTPGLPLTQGARETLTQRGLTLTIYPTPQIGGARWLSYAAGHALVAGAYGDDLTADRQALALIHAQAACLDVLAAQPAAGINRITDANGASFDFSGFKPAERAAGLRAQYEAGLRALNASAGGLG